jgi:hypothetical protein
VKRIIAGFTAFFAFTGTFLVLPVYAEPGPEPEPVETSAQEVELGSVEAPAPEADVQEGTTDPVAGVEPEAPVLTVSETGVDEFSLVGVSWAYDPAVTDTLVQVRVQNATGQWGPWTEVAAEDAVQEGEGRVAPDMRGGTAPLWTGPSTAVEAELVTRSGAQPTDVRLDLIDPGESEADSALQSPDITDAANAATAMPPVHSRAQWGADESLMTWTPQYASTIKAAALHHTAGSNSYTADQVPGILRSIYRYHAVTLKWGDIGYNVIVDKFGRLWEGRRGGLSRPLIGAHSGGFNTYTFGVSMIGTFETVAPPQPMVESAAAFFAWKLSLYGVDPNGTTTLVSGGTDKYPAGTRVTMRTIFGHRDSKSTACPGKLGYAQLPTIRALAASHSGHAAFVRSLYRDMMGRDGDEAGVRSWTEALTERGFSRRRVSAGFANSVEYRRLVIRQAYQQVLNRAPDPGGLTHWMTALSTGSVRLDTIRPALMTSKEFYLRGGSSDTAFVNNVYQAALGRSATAAEVTYWSAVRQRSGARAVLGAVWGSAEAAMRRVGQAYQYYLGRTSARAEREYWLPVVAGSGDERLREELVVSREYALRAVSRFP